MAEKESNFTGWLNEKILPLVGKFANTRFVRAVMGAGYSIIAFTIVGSIILRWESPPSSLQDLLLITTRKSINKKKTLIFHR